MGLDFVPKNGYRAELHFGERVLTASQAVRMDNLPVWSNYGRANDQTMQALIAEVKTLREEVQRQGEANTGQRAAVHSATMVMAEKQLRQSQQAASTI
jgi:hypothetical protein